MEHGEQCQKCGNDFDPMHPCRCRGDAGDKSTEPDYLMASVWLSVMVVLLTVFANLPNS